MPFHTFNITTVLSLHQNMNSLLPGGAHGSHLFERKTNMSNLYEPAEKLLIIENIHKSSRCSFMASEKHYSFHFIFLIFFIHFCEFNFIVIDIFFFSSFFFLKNR
uniref:Uncharacterized protein n=1 Tax=Cacopsylla melanoneura TaxID=428564 RepID=A0A8D8UMF7_9HEMI